MAVRARTDPSAFAAFVLRDEETGAHIVQTPLHAHWQGVLTQHDNAVLLGFIESGKSQQVSIARVLYELGRNPRLRVVLLSATKSLASKIADTLRRYIEHSDELHAVFPNLRPGSPWTGDAFRVAGAGITSKDYSVEVAFVGAHVLGSRYDLAVLDDALDWENTGTPYQRTKTESFIESMVVGRLSKHARLWAVGNPWHPDDYYHKLAQRPGFFARRWPVQDAHSTPLWPLQWPAERIEAFRQKYPNQFRRQLMCEAFSPESSRFSRSDIEACKAAAARRGIHTLVDWYEPQEGEAVVTGVDIGIGKKEGSGLCVLFTMAVNLATGERRVLQIETGLGWSGPVLVRNIGRTIDRFGSLCYVESNAAQKFIADFVTADAARMVKAFNTGANKNDPVFGVESIATEMEQGKWLLPSTLGGVPPKEVQEFIDECLYYDPAAHTGDRLMAAWIAREAARKLHRHKPASMVKMDTLRR